MRSLSIIVLATIVLLLGLPSTTLAQGENIGLGIILGSPTGLSAKFLTGSSNAVDVALGWTSGRINVHADYLWHKKNAINLDNNYLDFYFGVGGKFRQQRDSKEADDDIDNKLGIRGPAGLSWMVPKYPVEIFAEIALVMYLVPSTTADLDAGLGVRYYF